MYGYVLSDSAIAMAYAVQLLQEQSARKVIVGIDYGRSEPSYSPVEYMPYIDEDLPPSPRRCLCDRSGSWKVDGRLLFRMRVREATGGFRHRRLMTRQLRRVAVR